MKTIQSTYIALLGFIAIANCNRAYGNGGPFVVKYPNGDSSAKGVFAKMDFTLHPARETRKSESRNQWLPLQISDEPIDNNSNIELWIGKIRVEIKRGFDSKLLAEFLRTVGVVC
jgi:hypothetical protein